MRGARTDFRWLGVFRLKVDGPVHLLGGVLGFTSVQVGVFRVVGYGPVHLQSGMLGLISGGCFHSR